MPDASTASLELLFATPIMLHTWPDSEALNRTLSELILERERTTTSRSKSNIGGWQSAGDLAEWGGQAGQIVSERVLSMVDQATRQLFARFRVSASFAWKLSMWANVNRRGQYNKMHFHPGSTWSGTYYVDAGDPPPVDRPLSGHLGIVSPNHAASMSFFAGEIPHARDIRPESGLMILIPSYLQHTVYPYEGQRPRISIAFNVRKNPYP